MLSGFSRSFALGSTALLITYAASARGQVTSPGVPKPTAQGTPLPTNTNAARMVKVFGLEAPYGDKIHGDTILTVNLGSSAPAGGATVKLTSSAVTAVSFGGATNASASATTTVVVPEGTSSTTTKIYARSMNASSTLSAEYAGKTAQTALTVLPNEIESVQLAASSGVECDRIDTKVTLKGLAGPTGVAAVMSTSGTGVDLSGVTVTEHAAFVAPGAQSATISLVVRGVPAPSPVTVTATLNGKSASSGFNVLPVGVASFGIAPSSLLSGATATAKVTLDHVPKCDQRLVFSSSDPTIAFLANKFTTSSDYYGTIKAGQASGEIPILTRILSPTNPGAPIDKAVTMTVKATSAATKTTTLNVLWPRLVKSVSATPAKVHPGETVTIAATLDMPAPPGGTTLKVRSTSPSFTVPPTLIVPEGQLTKTLTLVASASPATSVGGIYIDNALCVQSQGASVAVGP